MRKHTRWTVLVWMLFTIAPAWAADLEMVPSAANTPIYGGENVRIDLHLLNHTDSAISRSLPVVLPCRIIAGRESVVVNARLAGMEATPTVHIPARQFAKRQYSLAIPVYTIGLVRVELETVDAPPLTIEVKKARPEKWANQQVPVDQGQLLAQSFLDDMSVYKPMYFLLGVDPGLDQSKFQLSFQYRLFNPDGFLAKKAPWVSGLHLGYTQRSIWDLKNDSRPFDDTSYMPELFYLIPKIPLNLEGVSAFGIQGGFLHESNGKGGDDSRSTNIVYLEPILAFHLAGPFHLKVAPRIFTYVNNSDSTNENLMDYRGYVDMNVGIINPEGLALDAHWGWAKKGSSVQLDLTYPMSRLLAKDLNIYLQAQYFSGYAETLLHYNERHDVFRLGFSIIR